MNFAYGESWDNSQSEIGSKLRVIPAFAGMTNKNERNFNSR
jgi:hypothetical protein